MLPRRPLSHILSARVVPAARSGRSRAELYQLTSSKAAYQFLDEVLQATTGADSFI